MPSPSTTSFFGHTVKVVRLSSHWLSKPPSLRHLWLKVCGWNEHDLTDVPLLEGGTPDLALGACPRPLADPEETRSTAVSRSRMPTRCEHGAGPSPRQIPKRSRLAILKEKTPYANIACVSHCFSLSVVLVSCPFFPFLRFLSPLFCLLSSGKTLPVIPVHKGSGSYVHFCPRPCSSTCRWVGLSTHGPHVTTHTAFAV